MESCRTEISGAASILPEATPEKATEWSDAAKGFAEALGIAARELGIATNDFLTSPAGVLLAAILLFNYAGGAIVGFPFTVFTILVLLWLVRRLTTEKVEYETVPLLWGLAHYRRKKADASVEYLSDGKGALLLLATLVMVILNLIVWVNVT